MKNVLKRLNNIEEYLLAFLLPFMCVVIFAATFLRFSNVFVITWAEELARYCMIWILFVGISAAAKKGEHFCVTAFILMMPKSVQRILIVVRVFLMTGFTLFVGRFCIVILKNQMMMGQVTPSLHWPMWCMYTAVLIGTVAMMVRYTLYAVKELRADKRQQ